MAAAGLNDQVESPWGRSGCNHRLLCRQSCSPRVHCWRAELDPALLGSQLIQQALLLMDGRARGAEIMVKIQDHECCPASGAVGLGFGVERASSRGLRRAGGSQALHASAADQGAARAASAADPAATGAGGSPAEHQPGVGSEGGAAAPSVLSAGKAAAELGETLFSNGCGLARLHALTPASGTTAVVTGEGSSGLPGTSVQRLSSGHMFRPKPVACCRMSDVRIANRPVCLSLQQHLNVRTA